MVKLIAFDLDGTSLVNHCELTEANKKALTLAHEKGIHVAPATGRLAAYIPKPILDLPFITYAIASNGARVQNLKTSTAIHTECIPLDIAKKVISILETHELYTEHYIDNLPYTLRQKVEDVIIKHDIPEYNRYFLTKNYSYFDDVNDVLNDTNSLIEKINMPYITPIKRSAVVEELKKIDGISFCSSVPNNLEINSIYSNKGNALQQLCNHLGISPEDCMAIGDNGNDIDMLKIAGVSVAMGNATDEVKKIAKYQTLSCEQDGLAKAIYDYCL